MIRTVLSARKRTGSVCLFAQVIIKLGILFIQTFEGQHEHAVSRFQILWALKLQGLWCPGHQRLQRFD